MDKLVIAKGEGFCKAGDIIEISGTLCGYADGVFTVMSINNKGGANLHKMQDEKIAKKRKYTSAYRKSHKRVW